LRRIIVILCVLIAACGLAAQQRVGIVDIQRTHLSGIDGTYPSPYAGKLVTLTGVVTAVGFDGDGFFISTPDGGPWSGLCVEAANELFSRGDYLELTGRIAELHGLTILRDISRVERLGIRPAPAPTEVTVFELSREESYESVLVCVDNAQYKTGVRKAARVSDVSDECRLDSRFSGVRLPASSVRCERVVGISVYAFGEYRLNPRTNDDLLTTVSVTRPSWGRVKSLYK
jgi:hypothetical protein